MANLPKFEPATEEALTAAGARLLSRNISTFAHLFEQLQDREAIIGLFRNFNGGMHAPALDELQFREWNESVLQGIQQLIGYYALQEERVLGYYETHGTYEPYRELDQGKE